MEHIDKKQKEIACSQTKAKKDWKRPELIIIDVKNTFSDPQNPGTDGELGGNNYSSA